MNEDVNNQDAWSARAPEGTSAPTARLDPRSGTPIEPSAIVIDAQDLQSADVHDRVKHLADAQMVPLVRAVGDAAATTPTTNRFSWRSVGIMSLAGILGGSLTWVLWQMTIDSVESALTGNLLMTFSMVFLIGLSVSAVDVWRTGSLEKVGRTMLIAVPAALGTGLVLGLLVHFFYSTSTQALVDRAITGIDYDGWTEQRAYDYLTTWLHPVRGIAWAVVGGAVGLTVGIASRSLRRTVITTSGGLVGGFLGGFLFDFIATDEGSEGLAQFVGVVLTGLLIGLSIALLEEGRKAAWIEITSGGMAGKQFILYQDIVTIGSSVACNITVIKDPAVLPEAAVITRKGPRAELTASAGSMVNVDGVMQNQTSLRDGSRITLGGTVLQYREKSGNQAEIGSVRQ